MPGPNKYLYILPDVSYVIDVSEAKQGNFKIDSFRQINGEFIDENDLIAANIEKLFAKLEDNQYFLVLPDSLFTNTILEVLETSKSKVKIYLEEELLPKLGVDESTHQITHHILTQFGNKSKVQLSALENEVLNPVLEAADKNKIKIEGVMAVSWLVKSLISLEPSLAVIQMGDRVYLSQHYIGLDQANDCPIGDLEKVIETVKTLKGAEPSLQTIYLLTNELVEEKLKAELKDVIPLQQLVTFVDEGKIPAFLEAVIEAGAKTLSVDDFHVPVFKPIKGEKVEAAEADVSETDDKEEVAGDEAELPTPTQPGEEIATLPTLDEDEEKEEPELEPTEEIESDEPEAAAEKEEEKEDEQDSDQADETEKDETEDEKDDSPILSIPKYDLDDEDSTVEPAKTETEESKDEPDLSQFAVHKTEEIEIKTEEVANVEPVKSVEPVKKEKPAAAVIKNNAGVGGMFKMLGVAFLVFLITVAVGVGVGFGLITLSRQGGIGTGSTASSPSPSPVVTPTPTPSPSPTPEPIAKDELEVLVVNATTIAGYAGETADALEADGFENVTARNARGQYEDGVYLLLDEEDDQMLEEVSDATDLDLEYLADEKETEDPSGNYDLVVVLAE